MSDYDHPPSRPRRRRPGHWTTKDGVTFAIRDMADSHLGNTLRFLERSRERWSKATRASYRELASEAVKRGIAWVVAHDDCCTFQIEDLTGDRAVCARPAVMLMPPKDGKQEPRCEEHRQDRLDYRGMVCDGCGEREVEFAYECVDTGGLYCVECALEPGGPIYMILCWIVFVLTLGCVKMKNVGMKEPSE